MLRSTSFSSARPTDPVWFSTRSTSIAPLGCHAPAPQRVKEPKHALMSVSSSVKTRSPDLTHSSGSDDEEEDDSDDDVPLALVKLALTTHKQPTSLEMEDDDIPLAVLYRRPSNDAVADRVHMTAAQLYKDKVSLRFQLGEYASIP